MISALGIGRRGCGRRRVCCGAGGVGDLGQFLGERRKDGVDRNAERFRDLLHVLVAQGGADLIGGDRQVALVLVEP